MGDLQKFFKQFAAKKSEFDFKPASPEITLPVKKYKYPTKLSLPYVIPKGVCKCNVQDKFGFVYESGKKIANTRGYVYRTEPRFKRLYSSQSGKLEYMETPKKIKAAAKPFDSGVPMFHPVIKSITEVPGPGTYDGELMPMPKIKRLGTFNGKTITVPPVTIKCSPTYEDRCSKCNMQPLGVYYQSDDMQILCRLCYGKLKAKCSQMNPSKRSALCHAFKKVRNCSFCHNHERSTAAVWTKPLALLHKQQVLETYFNRYF